MLPPKQTAGRYQRELLAVVARLDDRRRASLLDYARFLEQQVGGGAEAEAVAEEPLGLPRPQEETVVAAIRRLSQNYPMLDKEPLLHQASALMTAHVMHGREAREVIDELEQLFAAAFVQHTGRE